MPRHLKILFSIGVSVLILLAGDSLSLAANLAPSDKEIKKAQTVLVKLVELDNASWRLPTYKSAAKKFYPELYVKVSSLREGVLKTDLSTAVFLYEKAYEFARAGDSTIADCDQEVRDLYKNICHAEGPVTRTQLALSKARLHATWAGALLRYYRGDRDRSTMTTVDEIERERSIDLRLAERFVALLKAFEGHVNSYSSLAEFEAHNRIARVSFGQLSSEFEITAAAAYPILSSLPRTSLTYHLQNALNSYGDGLFWWEKTYRRKELVVSANNWTEPAGRIPLGFDAGTIDYAVISNWRKAGRHIANAQAEIEQTRNERLPVALVARGSF